jgi:hypothetical protein
VYLANYAKSPTYTFATPLKAASHDEVVCIQMVRCMDLKDVVYINKWLIEFFYSIIIRDAHVCLSSALAYISIFYFAAGAF